MSWVVGDEQFITARHLTARNSYEADPAGNAPGCASAAEHMENRATAGRY